MLCIVSPTSRIYGCIFQMEVCETLVTKERLLAHPLSIISSVGYHPTPTPMETGTQTRKGLSRLKGKKKKHGEKTGKLPPKFDCNIFSSSFWKFWSIYHVNFLFSNSMTLSSSLTWILAESLPVFCFLLTFLPNYPVIFLKTNIMFLVLVALSIVKWKTF